MSSPANFVKSCKFCEILQIQPDLVTSIKLHMGVGEITKIYVERYATKAEMNELAEVLEETKGPSK